MKVNQAGEEIDEEVVFASWTKTIDPIAIASAIALLCDHLHVNVIRTNATKHGNTEFELRSTL